MTHIFEMTIIPLYVSGARPWGPRERRRVMNFIAWLWDGIILR